MYCVHTYGIFLSFFLFMCNTRSMTLVDNPLNNNCFHTFGVFQPNMCHMCRSYLEQYVPSNMPCWNNASWKIKNFVIRSMIVTAIVIFKYGDCGNEVSKINNITWIG